MISSISIFEFFNFIPPGQQVSLSFLPDVRIILFCCCGDTAELEARQAFVMQVSSEKKKKSTLLL